MPEHKPLTWGYDNSISPRDKAAIDAEEKLIAARLEELRPKYERLGREISGLQWRFLHLGQEGAHRAFLDRQAEKQAREAAIVGQEVQDL